MKKLLVSLIIYLSLFSISFSKNTNFSNEVFKKAQLDGKTIVIHSWNKTCVTCARQVVILKQAKEDFKDILYS